MTSGKPTNRRNAQSSSEDLASLSSGRLPRDGILFATELYCHRSPSAPECLLRDGALQREGDLRDTGRSGDEVRLRYGAPGPTELFRAAKIFCATEPYCETSSSETGLFYTADICCATELLCETPSGIKK